jgi:hypothetical protein
MSLMTVTSEFVASCRDLTWEAVLSLVLLKIQADCRCGNVDPAEFVKLVFKEMEQYKVDGTRSEEK